MNPRYSMCGLATTAAFTEFAFLIEFSPPFYLTARHVVASAISKPLQPITGINPAQRKVALTVIGEDQKLDVALLKIDGIKTLHGVVPYEVFLSNMAPEDVTFAGLAFADEDHVRVSNPPCPALPSARHGQAP